MSGDSPTVSPKNPAGATPMISNDVFPISILRLSTCGSSPRRSRQKVWLITAKGEELRLRSTSGPKARPITG